MGVRKEIITTKYGDVEFITAEISDLKVSFTSFGAAIYEITIGEHLVTVAPKDLHAFMDAAFYYGKTVGRTAGRLVLPSFNIENNTYTISSYRGESVKLHGGPKGFSFRHFELESIEENNENIKITFRYESSHLEEEYPGNLSLKVTYQLNRELEISIFYEAIADMDTLCNITNHTFFNLSKDEEHILNHELTIHADEYLDIDEEMIIKSKKKVNDTPFDFRHPKLLGKQIQMMRHTAFMGFDHTWLLSKISHQITVDEPTSPVKLVVSTSYPSVVIYTHNHKPPCHLDRFKHQETHQAFTLECQYEPGGIHYQELNHSILRKNEVYKEFINYQFIRK